MENNIPGSWKRATTPAKETHVELFGSKKDPEVQTSINKVAITGRQTKLLTRPSFDTGLGQCGKHLCSCKHVCSRGHHAAFDGDMGSSQ